MYCSDAPTGAWLLHRRRVSVGYSHFRAIRSDQTVTCWGELPGRVTWHTADTMLWAYGTELTRRLLRRRGFAPTVATPAFGYTVAA